MGCFYDMKSRLEIQIWLSVSERYGMVWFGVGEGEGTGTGIGVDAEGVRAQVIWIFFEIKKKLA